ncbi:MAG: putative porin [Solirubrobacterales bacterium]
MMSKRRWQRWIAGLGILSAVVLLGPEGAAAQEDVNDLKAELQAQKQRQAELEEKIDQLEARQKLQEQAANEKAEEAAATTPEDENKPEAIPESLKWASRLQWYGDLRYRYEYIDDDAAAEDRHRNRIRARLGVDVKVSDEWNLGFRLATGTTESNGISGDPVSTNQTLDEAFSKKPIWLDLAFFGYHPVWLRGLDVFGGKINMPFYKVGRNELIWDSDLTPEGGAIAYARPLTERTTANLAAGGFWVNEESSGQDVSLWGLQGFLKHQFNEPTYLVGGASWYDYGNIQGSESLAREWKGTDDFFGNTAAGDVFASDYDLFELFAEFGTSVAKVPVAVFGDWVQNTVAVDDSEDTGWLIGGQINQAKDPGSWQFEYDYRDLQLDAVVGQFSASDFVGGGTGGKGHRFAFTYMVAKNVAAALTYYADEYHGRKGDAEYDRIEADLGIKF